MSCEWSLMKLSDVIVFNPKEKLSKGEIAVKVAMENIQPFTKHFSEYSLDEYGGGAKFRDGDTIMARITPCLENEKTAFVKGFGDQVLFGSTEFNVLRAVPEKTDPEFVYYLAISSLSLIHI